MQNESTNQHWSQVLADKVLKSFPDKDVYTCAAGISPSGTVHFGNFRDVMTSLAVAKQLKAMGKNVRLIFSWDNFDRFRKVPLNIDPSFSKYIGLPLTGVPDPEGKCGSYAEHFQKEFEQSMNDLGIELEYRYQTDEYKSGRYDKLIVLALQKRKEIAEILLSFMSGKAKQEKGIDEEKFKNEYYPISLYSRFTDKDSVRILNYDGQNKITYQCLESGKTEEIDITKNHIVKFAWKTDWAMRWGQEGVVFEPGGVDHASPGGSYDVSSVIAKKIFGVEPPVFAGYQFVGLRGLDGKMSGSKGNAVTPGQLLEIYEPSLLKWLYLSKSPDSVFNLAFDSEIYRQYSELDAEFENYKKGELDAVRKQTLELTLNESEKIYKNPIPFRQAVALGQIIQWNPEKLTSLLDELKTDYDPLSIKSRLSKARNWLETYNPDQMISLREEINREYLEKIAPEAVELIKKLKISLEGDASSVEKLEEIVYGIPKDPGLDIKANIPLQKAFFKDIYNLLIGKDQGPRLATFLWAVDRKKVLKLLDI
ncbi:MAG: lysine--tRNA ligase [Candidatus Paceibacterota bacterium]|jgi:lysyl-tRNA synthetase class 1